MQVPFNTDSNLDGTERFAQIAENIMSSSLRHLESRITRVEVYLADTNATKSTPDHILCMIEARAEGRQSQIRPISRAEVEAAVCGDAKKVCAALNNEFDKHSRR